MWLRSILFFPAVALATLKINDPSNVISPRLWAADNAIVPDYSVQVVLTQPSAIEAVHTINRKSASAGHLTWSATSNDTSVLLVSNNSTFQGSSHMNFHKSGYYSNLYEASFWGFNAAVNVANASTSRFDHVNVTVHNGAAQFYSYGEGTVVEVTDAWLYSSGPVSHGLYAAGYGTIIGRNVQVYTGGRRSSSFSGDSPVGHVYVYDSIAHAAGIGSATFYALGDIYGEHVLSLSEMGPVVFSDGGNTINLVDCDCTAGLLGGVVMFSDAQRQSADMPGLWFGNVIAHVTLDNAQLETKSGVLVVANYSALTQDFDYYADYSDNSNLLPAEVTISVTESDLTGDLVAYNESSISWSLGQYSRWKGCAYSGYGKAFFDVSLDATSQWTLTRDTYVRNLTDSATSLDNIKRQGHTLYYNATASHWLKGKTVRLSGGGSAKPMSSSSGSGRRWKE